MFQIFDAQFNSFLTHVLTLSHWEIALFALGLLLQGALFNIIPEEGVFLGLGVLCAKGVIGFFEAFGISCIGVLGSDVAILWFGKNMSKQLIQRNIFQNFFNETTVERGKKLIKRYGTSIVFLTRFAEPIRAPVYLALGAIQMPIVRFLKLDAIALTIQVPIFLIIGTQLGTRFSLAEATRWVVIISIVLFLTGVLATFWLARRDSVPQV